MSFVGEKESVIDVRAKGMRIGFAAMRVKASEGELQRAMQVGATLEGLRRSMKLRAREMRSIARELGSRKRVAWAYCMAIVPREMSALAGTNSMPCRTGELRPMSLSYNSIER